MALLSCQLRREFRLTMRVIANIGRSTGNGARRSNWDDTSDTYQ
jgi:hypothetical protein